MKLGRGSISLMDGAAAHEWADLVHAHDARAHSLALWMNDQPLVKKRPMLSFRDVSPSPSSGRSFRAGNTVARRRCI